VWRWELHLRWGITARVEQGFARFEMHTSQLGLVGIAAKNGGNAFAIQLQAEKAAGLEAKTVVSRLRRGNDGNGPRLTCLPEKDRCPMSSVGHRAVWR